MRRPLVLVVLLFLFWAPGAYAWTWPVQGPVLLGFTFDASHPYAGGQHRGIDVGASPGTPVVAPASGTVTFAGTVPTSGKSVTIATADGYSVTLTHLGSIAVSKGAGLGEGDGVGTVGTSGTPELDVPYVYMGVRVTAEAQGYLDPLSFLPALPPPVVATAPPPPPPPVSETAPAPTETATTPSEAAATTDTTTDETVTADPPTATTADAPPAEVATGAPPPVSDVASDIGADPPAPDPAPADPPASDAPVSDAASVSASTPPPASDPAPEPTAAAAPPAAPPETSRQAPSPEPPQATVISPDPGFDPTAPADATVDTSPVGAAPAPPAVTVAPLPDVTAVDDAFRVHATGPATTLAVALPIVAAARTVVGAARSTSPRIRVVASPRVRRRTPPRAVVAPVR
ncbi:MAG TPA: M23 family metallopeptidase, partial [Gaiellaceae bacterium]|nr:M23 family metallopeptidase [Gaiellaceae bacterium]